MRNNGIHQLWFAELSVNTDFNQAGLKFKDPPASVSPVMKLKAPPPSWLLGGSFSTYAISLVIHKTKQKPYFTLNIHWKYLNFILKELKCSQFPELPYSQL